MFVLVCTELEPSVGTSAAAPGAQVRNLALYYMNFFSWINTILISDKSQKEQAISALLDWTEMDESMESLLSVIPDQHNPRKDNVVSFDKQTLGRGPPAANHLTTQWCGP